MLKADHAKGEIELTPARLRAFLRDIEKPAGVSGCWLWRGGKNRDGYGQNSEPVHRRAYRWMVGPVPVGMELDHLCRTRNCVNPHHLEPVTKAENQRRRNHPGREWHPRPYCRRGHALTGDNVKVWSKGGGRMGIYCYLCHDGERSSDLG